MKKRNIIIISSIVAVLIIVVVVTAFLNAGNMQEKKDLEEKAIMQVMSGGGLLGKIDMDLIREIGIKNFYANLDTSDSDPEEHQYSGIPVNDALKVLEINIDDYSTVTAKAIDGYNVVFDVSEIMDEDSIWIAIEKDGKPLGSKSSGGSGPYQIIIKKDAFSQRWCKFVIELELK